MTHAFADAESLSRAVGRPPPFTGLDAEWEEWSFVMRSYCVLHDIADEGVFTTIETAPGALENPHLGPVHSAKSASRFEVLAAQELALRGGDGDGDERADLAAAQAHFFEVAAEAGWRPGPRGGGHPGRKGTRKR